MVYGCVRTTGTRLECAVCGRRSANFVGGYSNRSPLDSTDRPADRGRDGEPEHLPSGYLRVAFDVDGVGVDLSTIIKLKLERLI